MISVAIFINGNPIYTRSAHRISDKEGVGKYKVDTGEVVEHAIDEGAIPLAKKLLDTIKE